ncbi:Ras-specific guanine nucleotide-releasing factor RalGPS2 [Araneus ventricosus]|uniref:Ras-specific guanine nucleotide-releasing factor RalGPS2 n=1 Tax=Araneus ventricosus TaxID=182803 RepID=A0A4Y2QNH4_ARAVE|nr:Ras-specific guanine nucleotide-releasing factor RalGPS2 [Araneus ventricosus]GBN64902.1 Ras-specific guanine nucleotide-releasing factor RalGPS2 [Araneus ventricosus]
MASKVWYFLKRKINPVPRIKIPVAAFFMDVSPKIYAEQLTIVDADIFERIRLAELLYPPFGPVVDETISRFNHVKMWCVRTILYQSCRTKRSNTISHFLKIATELHHLKNFNSMMAILSALESAPIQRLTNTWSLVSKSQKQTYDNLSELLSWENNFRCLRDHMSTVKGPCVPYLGLYMNDIIGIYADYPLNEISNSVRLAKMEKVIKSVLLYQGSNYSHLRIWPNIQNLLETYRFSKKELSAMEKFNLRWSKTLEE